MVTQWEVIYCPACNAEVFRHFTEPDSFHASVPRSHQGYAPDILTAMVMASEQAQRERIERVERACTVHFRDKHPYRYWVWQKFGWKSALTKRLRRLPNHPLPDDTQEFELVDFIKNDEPGTSLEVAD
jgi:hypothetical protein